MKALVSLALMFPLMCQAALSTPNYTPEPSLKTFVCSKYTDNTVDPKVGNADGFMTDNPVQDSETKITLTEAGYTIQPGNIFPDGRALTNPGIGDAGTFAGDTKTMLFKRENDSGNPYFLIYITPEADVPGKSIKEQTRDNPITRLVTVAACTSI